MDACWQQSVVIPCWQVPLLEEPARGMTKSEIPSPGGLRHTGNSSTVTQKLLHLVRSKAFLGVRCVSEIIGMRLIQSLLAF